MDIVTVYNEFGNEGCGRKTHTVCRIYRRDGPLVRGRRMRLYKRTHLSAIAQQSYWSLATASLCKTTQCLTNAKLTAKLFVKGEGEEQVTLRAYDATIRAITDTPVGKVTSESLLFSAAFDVTYNKYNVIIAVSRK